jgi:Bacterial Ig-like domain (group 2)
VTGAVTHEGSATADVARGGNPPLVVRLYPRAGQLPVDVTIGAYTIAIVPAETRVVVGASAPLVALVVTAEGDTLRDRAHWASLDATVAAVDQQGRVTGRGVGEARVVATCGDVGFAARVSVVAPPPPAEEWVVIARMNLTEMSAASGIYSVRPDGSGLTRLTSYGASDETPALSPDRGRIPFVRHAALGMTDGRIYVMNADGSALAPLFPDRAGGSGRTSTPPGRPTAPGSSS